MFICNIFIGPSYTLSKSFQTAFVYEMCYTKKLILHWLAFFFWQHQCVGKNTFDLPKEHFYTRENRGREGHTLLDRS